MKLVTLAGITLKSQDNTALCLLCEALVSRPKHRDVEWQQERNRLLTTYFPTRTDFLVNLLRQYDLFPGIDAPVYSTHGGILPSDPQVSISTLEGDDNNNGLSNFVEYAIGDSLAIGSSTVDAEEFPTLTITRNLAADDVTITMETSEDLIDWRRGCHSA